MSHVHCVAHILRGLDALTEFHGEAWSAEMRKLLQGTVHEVNEAARAGEPLSAEAADRIERECGEIIAAAVARHEALPPLDGGKRRERRKKRKRDLQMLKVHERAYGCCRSERGTRSCAILRTLIETARKQEQPDLDTLQMEPADLSLRPADS